MEKINLVLGWSFLFILLLLLWSSSKGVNVFIKVCNIIYNEINVWGFFKGLFVWLMGILCVIVIVIIVFVIIIILFELISWLLNNIVSIK